MKKIVLIVLLLFSLGNNAQSVTLNSIPQINCPSGVMTICGTYTMPVGGPYDVTFELEITGTLYLVTGGDQYVTSLTNSTFCLTVPMSVFGPNPAPDNYEISIMAFFTLQTSPFTELSAFDDNTNTSGADIYIGNCPIVANDDTVTFNECTAGGTINVLTNDVFLGAQATTSNVVITQTTTSSQLTLNTLTGVATIASNTPPGTYNISYQICNLNNASQCDSGIISVTITPATLVASNDNFTSTFISSCSGGTTPIVLSNDTLCGNVVNATDFTLSLVSATPTLPVGTSISNAGAITIPAGTAANSYTINYTICQNANPVNCSTASVTIIVSAPVINAVNDNFNATPINTLTGGDTASVFANDILNGGAVDGNNVTVTLQDNPYIYGETISGTGIITIPPGTPNGTYTLVYIITQNGCSTNSDTGSVTIVINEQTINTPPLAAGVRANNVVSLVDTQSDGKIIIAGYFTEYNSIPCLSIARLKTDLTFDNALSFNVVGPSPANQLVQDMKVYKNSGAHYNKILLVGSFTGFSGGTHGTGIVRLNADGTIDTSFNTYSATGVNPGASGVNDQIRTCFIYPDGSPNAGKILIGGMFDKYNNYPSNKLARLNADGSLDTAFSDNINTITNFTFSATAGFNSSPQRILVDTNERIVVGGYFTQYNGVTKKGIARLLPGGTLDMNFAQHTGITSSAGFPNFIQDMVLQPDEKIIIGGSFQKYGVGTVRNNIARLNNDGTCDTFSFNVTPNGFNNTIQNPVTGTYGLVRSLVYEPASTSFPFGKLYVGGDFSAYNGIAVKTIIKLDLTNGNDTGMSVGAGPNGTVWSLKRQGDGKIILGGQFTMFATSNALNITRIAQSGLEAKNGIGKGNGEYVSEPEIDVFANQDNNISIFPNPSQGIFNIAINNFESSEITIKVYTLLGQIVYNKTMPIKEFNSLDLRELQRGNYFATFSDGLKTFKKVIIIQ